MTPQIQKWVEIVKRKYIPSSGRVLEVGSLDINGSVRQFFGDATEYIGVDMQSGAGVDIVLNAHDFLRRFAKRSFDTILCLEMLEHDDNPFKTIKNLHSLLKKGGFLIISTPTTGFPYHPYPKDYFRYTKDAYVDIFFRGFEILEIGDINDDLGYPGIVCIGKLPLDK